ncbi:hypothetical protein D3C77_703510 [compost metagenome]
MAGAGAGAESAGGESRGVCRVRAEYTGGNIDLQDRETEHRDCRQTGGVRAGCYGQWRADFACGDGADGGAVWQHFAGGIAGRHVAVAQDQWFEGSGYVCL